jgi:hypothetical protein
MNLPFTNVQIIVAAAILAVVLIIVLVVYRRLRNRRTAAFKNRFGSEYDRAVVTHGSPRQAESKLAARENRVEALKIRELGPAERERFLAQWESLQSRFVDHPKSAVSEADDLINALLLARGYPQNGPQNGFEQRAEDISVTYPTVMENYRLANGVAVRPNRTDATTEELRTAMIQYRAVFDELIRAQTTSVAIHAA